MSHNSGYSYTVSCPYEDNYKDYGPLHLLRCQGSKQKQQCSDPDYPVYLVCGKCG